ncbi:MAG: VanW family protein [Aquihabitans sp.]
MRRPRLRLVLGIALPLLVIVLLLAAWAIDTSSASGKVPRNTTLAGRDVSTFGEDDLAATVADVADEYATSEVQVRTEQKSYKVPASELGLMLDEDATVKAALDLDTGPIAWGESFLDERTVPLTFVVDDDQLKAGLAELGGNAKPTEPKIAAGADGFTVVSGSDGTTIDADGVAKQLRERAERGQLPLVVDAEAVAEAPKVTDASAQALADQLSKGTANGLQVTSGASTVDIPAATTRAWLSSKVEGDKLVAQLDAEKAKADLTSALPDATEPKDAKVVLENGAPKIIPSSDGATCCAADTPARLLAAINGGSGAVEVALDVKKAAFTTEAAQKLGIKEPVGTTTDWKGVAQVKSFTTYYPCCAARVTNIQRIADIVSGTVIKPGEKFDMNAIVGQRTTEKGFVSAGAIAEGKHVDEVGGGVSQFATTTFNAAFFAGLPINTYQAHSEHFDRYPYGREATMGYPNPNLVWTNNTPYGILVEATHTDTSVTVRLWSTQYAYGEQTGQTTGKSGSCTTVQTTRTIHYPDGKTGTDTFQARYRVPGQTTC